LIDFEKSSLGTTNINPQGNRAKYHMLEQLRNEEVPILLTKSVSIPSNREKGFIFAVNEKGVIFCYEIRNKINKQ
jgi:hypothetical protein